MNDEEKEFGDRARDARTSRAPACPLAFAPSACDSDCHEAPIRSTLAGAARTIARKAAMTRARASSRRRHRA